MWGGIEGVLRVFEVLTGRGAGGYGARMGLQKGFRRASVCVLFAEKEGETVSGKYTPKGPKRPSKARMSKTTADPFKKAHVFQTAAKLRPNCGINCTASLVKHPLQKVKNDLARVKTILNRGAKTWCSTL